MTSGSRRANHPSERLKRKPGKGYKHCTKCESKIGSPCQTCPNCKASCKKRNLKSPFNFKVPRKPRTPRANKLLIMPFSSNAEFGVFGN
jgi:hypothetical protein